MTTETLQELAASNTWLALLPELLLALAALLLLVGDVVLGRRPIWGQILTAVTLVGGATWISFNLQPFDSPNGSITLFGGMLAQTGWSDLMRLFLLASALVVSQCGSVFFKGRPLPRLEFDHLLLVVTAALMLFVQSVHFALLFVSLETATIAFFVLVAFNRESPLSLEAGLKYLVLGGLSSGLLLFGIVLVYGAAGQPEVAQPAADAFSFGEIARFAAAESPYAANNYNIVFLAGAMLVLCGMAFKLGVVPFQIWIPDVYQGAPSPVTGLLAVSSKAAGVYALYVLLQGPFASLRHFTEPLLVALTAATLLFGNIAPLSQRNVKRVLGLSGVAHAGVILLGLVAAFYVEWAWAAVFFYLVTYGLGVFSVIAVMSHLDLEEDASQEFQEYEGLMRQHPFLGGSLAVGLGSLAGIPPFAGFVGKLLIFVAAAQAGLYGLLGLALLGVVISIYYYFGWIRAAVFRVHADREEQGAPVKAVGLVPGTVMTLLIAGSIVLGLYQGFFSSLF